MSFPEWDPPTSHQPLCCERTMLDKTPHEKEEGGSPRLTPGSFPETGPPFWEPGVDTAVSLGAAFVSEVI